MEKLFAIYNQSSMSKVFSRDNALNQVKINNNIMTHKQIEMKNGRIYMRMKKRDLLQCS
jgi:uncharacterized surface protein with fasciclin (FAS1) repeats